MERENIKLDLTSILSVLYKHNERLLVIQDGFGDIIFSLIGQIPPFDVPVQPSGYSDKGHGILQRLIDIANGADVRLTAIEIILRSLQDAIGQQKLAQTGGLGDVDMVRGAK